MLSAIARLQITEFPNDQAPAYRGKSKLEVLMGPEIWEKTRGRTVLDFGCGLGIDTVDLAVHGAERVIGIDIRQRCLQMAAARAATANVADGCVFATTWEQPVDVIVCVDSFEHFADPVSVLATMRQLLKPGGQVLVSFGPPWQHPLGGHVYSIFPFSHLVFPDAALVRWRSTFHTDGAKTILESGLNKMTVRRFERLIAASPFQAEDFEAVPIKKLRPIANRLTREFTTSIVRCRLIPRE
jgi:SAM-dependent methyltransferase